MTDAAAGFQRAESVPDVRSKTPSLRLDIVMLLLAIVSVVLVVWITFFPVSQSTYHAIVVVDAVICAIFAVEFLWRWRRAGWPWTFPLLNWYEILGMIPVASPWFRSFRLLRIVVILLRLGRVADRALGERVTATVVSRSVNTIVDIIKRPMTIAILDEVSKVLRTGHYTRNIAAALEENHAEIDQMIVDLIKNDPQTGKVRYIPFHNEIVRLIADTVYRMLQQLLADPRTDELVADMLRENIDQIGEAVRHKVEVAPSLKGHTPHEHRVAHHLTKLPPR
ncbi:ion transporter [Nocardia thailandica]|uniref:Ion transporter n=1 Tax=Nocardia thailandica TaxID=257275 RepID=A0ABW6PHC3_9NOCA|nr:ion transporter [Nocardia thailandica]